MIRLTYWSPSENGGGEWRANVRGAEAKGEEIDLLAAYEDIGLTPEDVKEWIIEGKAVRIILSPRVTDRLDAKRLEELVYADAEGRLVVLPCKENTLVWKISHRINGKHEIEQKYFNLTYSRVEDFGKTLFLTREEAEQALKEAKEDD